MPGRAATLSLIACLITTGTALARGRHVAEPTVRLELAAGALEVRLVPDRGRPLPLTTEDGRRWVFHGDTGDLVGRSYDIELANRSPERLKVVVSVDGLNVYDRVPVIGRSDRDTGSILQPWSERTLRGWQVDLDTAQRFVFAPPEWSEGRNVTDSKIGLVEVHVYRERWSEPARDRESASAGSSLKQRSAAESLAAPEPGLGTSSGDDVRSPVRVVRFEARTLWPEALAELDYGRRGWRSPRPSSSAGTRLGVEVVGDREGARVLSVVPGSTADHAGLVPGDVITRADAVIRPTPADLRRLMDRKRAGDRLFLELRRGAHQLALKIRVE